MKKYINKLSGLLLNFLIIVIVFFLIISLYMFFQTSIMHKKHSNVLGYTVFEVKTGSMSGSIEIGDLVVVKILNENEKNSLKENDIISFNDENYIVTHRIEEIGKEIITKGDANNASDKPINKEKIIGKVIKVIPKIGIYKKVLLDKKVFLLICLTISLFVISFSIDESKDDKKNILKNKKEKGNNDNEDKNKKE